MSTTPAPERAPDPATLARERLDAVTDDEWAYFVDTMTWGDDAHDKDYGLKAMALAVHARRELAQALERTAELEQFKRAVRDRVVVEFFKNTVTTTDTEDSAWMSCRLCSWTWRKRDQEAHEPTCPLAPKEPPHV